MFVTQSILFYSGEYKLKFLTLQKNIGIYQICFEIDVRDFYWKNRFTLFIFNNNENYLYIEIKLLYKWKLYFYIDGKMKKNIIKSRCQKRKKG